MITDHVFRRDQAGERRDECAYMNCRRPRAEHERSNERGDAVAEGIQGSRS